MAEIQFTDVFGRVNTLSGISQSDAPDFSKITDVNQLKDAINSYVQSQFSEQSSILNGEATANEAYLQNAASALSSQKVGLDQEHEQIVSAMKNLSDYEEQLIMFKQELINDAGGVLYSFDNEVPAEDQTITATAAAATTPQGAAVQSPAPLAALAAFLLF